MRNRRIINVILKKHGLQAKADYLFNEEPQLENIADSLIEFITPYFIGENLPLYEECIVSGVGSVNKDLDFNENVKLYLQNIVAPAHWLIDKRIKVETKFEPIAWVPMTESIKDFLDRNECSNPFMELEDDDSVRISKHEASLMLAARIMPAYRVSYILELISEPATNE